MKKINNDIQKVWKPCYFELNYIPNEGYSIEYSVSFDNEHIKQFFTDTYGTPVFKSLERCVDGMAGAIQNCITCFIAKREECKTCIEQNENEVRTLVKSPYANTPGSEEYQRIYQLRERRESLEFMRRLIEEDITFVLAIRKEFNELRKIANTYSN